MVPVLPYDIWCHVASFIPKTTLVKLYGINSAFFHLALHEVYGEAHIYHVGDERTLRCLLNMSATVAHHVTTLILRPHLFGSTASRRQDFGAASLSESAWKCLRRVNKTAKPSNYVASRILLRHIAQMTQVKSLKIGCYPSDDLRGFKSASSFVHTAWSTLHSRLRFLNLAIPLEAYSNSNIFSSDLPLESLEGLTIVLRKAYKTTDDGEIMPAITSFINRQHKSLISLTIDTPEATVDPSPLFNALNQLPRLTKLSVLHPVARLQPPDGTGIDIFLGKHAQQVEEFKFRFYGTNFLPTSEEIFSNPIFQINLPRLSYLDLGLFQWPKFALQDVTDGLVRYLGRVRRSLTRLAVRDCVLTFPQVVSLVSVISSETSNLRRLEMHVYFLSCSLLDLLSQKLPMLHRLGIWFGSLRSRDDGTWIPNNHWTGYNTQASGFVQAMAERKYPDWALRHFTVRPLYYCSGRWDESRRLLASALPGVVLFNGQSGDEFADIPDYTK